jgi:hypothetical protein
MQRIIDLKLMDATLERLKQSGISVKSDFTVKPGTYLCGLWCGIQRDRKWRP